MAKKAKKDDRKIMSIFEPRIICGEEIEPFCIPTNDGLVSNMVAAGTNLFWFAMHEALADGRLKEAKGLAKIIVDIVGRELPESKRQEVQDILDEIFEEHERNNGLN